MPWPMRCGLSFSTTATHALGAGAGGLAGVDGGLEAGRARAREQVRVRATTSGLQLERVLLRAGEVDADHAARRYLIAFSRMISLSA